MASRFQRLLHATQVENLSRQGLMSSQHPVVTISAGKALASTGRHCGAHSPTRFTGNSASDSVRGRTSRRDGLPFQSQLTAGGGCVKMPGRKTLLVPAQNNWTTPCSSCWSFNMLPKAPIKDTNAMRDI